MAAGSVWRVLPWLLALLAARSLAVAGPANASTSSAATQQPVLPTTAVPEVSLEDDGDENCTIPRNYCLDKHQECGVNDGQCKCMSGYKKTKDPLADALHICRIANKSVGLLDDHCNDVSDCNYKIIYVECSQKRCRCREPYTGFSGGEICYDSAMGWSVAIKTAGITVMVLAVGFFVAFALKACSRTRLRRHVAWLRRSSDVSFRSEDFYGGATAGYAVGDRPPSYTEEDRDKPPNYEELFPEEQDGAVNAGFCPDEAAPPPPPAARTAVGLSERPTEPTIRQPAAGAGRGHRRGLSGPAAIHLGRERGPEDATPTADGGAGQADDPGASQPLAAQRQQTDARQHEEPTGSGQRLEATEGGRHLGSVVDSRHGDATRDGQRSGSTEGEQHVAETETGGREKATENDRLVKAQQPEVWEDIEL